MDIIRILFSVIAMASQFFGASSHISINGMSPRRRPPTQPTLLQSPEQVHISLSGKDHMRISWITKVSTPATVYYGTISGNYTSSTNGSTNTYNFLIYKSGEIHNVVVGPLRPNTLYYYRCGINTNSSPEFTFKTPPARFPIKLIVVGDLGQTKWSESTLNRIAKLNYDVLLLPGDLSYANRYQPVWDKFGRLVEPLASKRPWMVTAGNHEMENIKGIHREKFTSYNARWVMPYEESGSPSNLFYSFEVGGVHVIMLGSYVEFGPDSAQYRWLQADLRKVDRRITPWLVTVVHAPWYNSNEDHQLDYASLGMKKDMEDVLYRARVDVVFAGHVHAYERFVHVYKDRANECGPVYITAGGGGNSGGLARRFKSPAPKITAFREASFGHGQFTVVNASHAVWTMHRNSNKIDVAGDRVLLRSLASISTC